MKRPVASIVSIGEELIRGEIVDTNSAFIESELFKYGIKVCSVIAVPDEATLIAKALSQSLELSDLVITTGGLGPTTDDITREVLAEVTGVELVLDNNALEDLTNKLKKRNREVNQTNRRQAYFPKGALVIKNDYGTADSFIAFSLNKKPIVSLPGVPREMKPIFKEHIIPWFEQHCSNLSPYTLKRFKTFGLSEAYLGELIESCNISDSIYVQYRVAFPELCVTLIEQRESDSAAANALLEQSFLQIKEKIGEEYILSLDHEHNMAEVVGQLLGERKLKIAFAESCTGGQISSSVVAVPGSSDYFLGSVVSYDNLIKQSILGVSASTLDDYGAVSEQTATAMALGVKKITGADISISATGIAGPAGGSTEKPVGTVYIGLAYLDEPVQTISILCPFERNMFRAYVASYALDLVRRKLLNYKLDRKSL